MKRFVLFLLLCLLVAACKPDNPRPQPTPETTPENVDITPRTGPE